MFHVDERSQPAALLRLGNDRQCERGFARRFRAENFDDSSSRESADTQSAVYENVAGGNDIDVDDFLVTEAHNGAVTVILGDLLNCQVEIFISRGCDFVGTVFGFRFDRHIGLTLSTSRGKIRQAKSALRKRVLQRANRRSAQSWRAVLGSASVSGVGKSVPAFTKSPQDCFGETPKPTPETGALPRGLRTAR